MIDLIVNIRDHLQGATHRWNGLPAIMVTTTMINNSECASLKGPVWNHLCNFSNIQQGGGNYHEAMMTPRDSSTSPAVSLCWGSNTSSFRIRHTVFSDTRPSLWGGGREQKGQFYLKVYRDTTKKTILPVLQVQTEYGNVVNSQEIFSPAEVCKNIWSKDINNDSYWGRHFCHYNNCNFYSRNMK